MKVLIAGAGIGGLTAALMLQARGHDVLIFERAAAVREIGVGINMLPHAVAELAALGLMPELDEAGIRTAELIYANRRGQPVWREPRGLAAGHAFPQISIHRGRLLGLIHRAVVERLGSGAIMTSSPVAGFEQGRRGVSAHGRGIDGKSWTASGDILVGADGIHSTIRSCLYPGEGDPIWNGVMLWRGCTEWPTWRDGRTMAIAGGNSAKFVFYPVGQVAGRPNRRLTNWAVMAKVGKPGASPPRREDWSRPGVEAEVLPFVRDRFRLDFVDPAAIIRACDPFYEYPNCDRGPLPRWSFGRVTLLGDAAHPMYPVGSNGASQAILDARCLCDRLTDAASAHAALAAYDAERRPATEKIILSNREGGPERVIDLVEARAPGGFQDIELVASHAERKAVVQGYARLAGYAAESAK